MRQMQIKLRLRQLCDRSSWAINTPTRQAQLMDLSFSNNAFWKGFRLFTLPLNHFFEPFFASESQTGTLLGHQVDELGLLVRSALSISHIFWHEQEQGNAIHREAQHRENRVWQHNPLLSLWPGQLGKAQTDMEFSNFTPTLCYKSRIVGPCRG